MNQRLDELAKMVKHGARVADIGSDHAYLPIKLIKNGQVKFAIASDVAQGPVANAKKDIERAGLQDQISVRLGPGLSTVSQQDQIDTVVIAGMGGSLMVDILNDGLQAGQIFPHLVLEPNVGERYVRAWLVEHKYKIIDEQIMQEAGHIYELISAELTEAKQELTAEEVFFGPLLSRAKSAVYLSKWTGQLSYFEQMRQNLLKAKQPDQAKIAQISQWIEMIKEQLK